MSTTIQELEDLRRDIIQKADQIRTEAARLEADRPDDAAHLRRIAERLSLYMSDYLEA